MTHPSERRRHRSNNPKIALTLQLLASQQRLRAKAVVLADHHGHVIARSTFDPMADEVASFGPALAQPSPWNGRLRVDGTRLDVSITKIRLGQQTGYLCSLGGNSDEAIEEMNTTGQGVRRILRR
jgi:hypothetical protein